LVTGNLEINKNLNRSGPSAGCFFIVEESTIIDSSVTEVNAFIITKKITTNDGVGLTNTLLIRGGVIITKKNEFLRTIDNSLIPSEKIEYEGARYIKLFRDVLSDPIMLNIKDTQYGK
jgi:hypothetical protein